MEGQHRRSTTACDRRAIAQRDKGSSDTAGISQPRWNIALASRGRAVEGRDVRIRIRHQATYTRKFVRGVRACPSGSRFPRYSSEAPPSPAPAHYKGKYLRPKNHAAASPLRSSVVALDIAISRAHATKVSGSAYQVNIRPTYSLDCDRSGRVAKCLALTIRGLRTYLLPIRRTFHINRNFETLIRRSRSKAGHGVKRGERCLNYFITGVSDSFAAPDLSTDATHNMLFGLDYDITA